MATHMKEDYGPYVARLKALPFVEDAHVEPFEPPRGQLQRQAAREGTAWDALLHLRVAGREHRFRVELKRTPRLNYALLEAFLARVERHGDARWILFAPYVTTPIAARLQEQGVNYVDLAGNCHLKIDQGHVAVIEGRRPPRRPEDAQPTGPVRYKVLFALLARPETKRTTVRDIADQAGVGKTVVAVTLKRLEEEGLIGQTETNTFLVKPRELLDRWLTGYLDVLRPKLLAGYYRAADRDPLALEQRIEQALAGPRLAPDAIKPHEERIEGGGITKWAWGGATAAFRLTGHYRGEQTVLHMDHRPAGLAQGLRLLPARTGEIAIVGTPGFFAYEGAAPRTVHPLLVYAELFVGHDDRAREAAAEVRERFLRHLG
jgi:hypothetical protein